MVHLAAGLATGVLNAYFPSPPYAAMRAFAIGGTREAADRYFNGEEIPITDILDAALISTALTTAFGVLKRPDHGMGE
jgi:hypothetical protein